jgi:hypothetical protein
LRSSVSLAKEHPDVLHDLQRVCGTCTTTSRCAHDFAVHRVSGRDEYCPNTCTLYALKQEVWVARTDHVAAPDVLDPRDQHIRMPAGKDAAGIRFV